MNGRRIRVEREIAAPRRAVWGVLADFPGISRWNSGVKASRQIGGAAGGVGARRHCDLAPVGGLDETVREWEEGERLLVSIDRATRVPIKHGEADFRLEDGPGRDSTRLTLTYDYVPNGGPAAGLVGRVLDSQLRSGFEGMLRDVEAAATASLADRP